LYLLGGIVFFFAARAGKSLPTFTNIYVFTYNPPPDLCVLILVHNKNMKNVGENVGMIRFAFATIAVVVLVGLSALAQDATPKIQVFGGYSLIDADSGKLSASTVDAALRAPGAFSLSSAFTGWNAEAQYNPDRWVGIVADFGGQYGTPIRAGNGSTASGLPNATVYSFLIGPAVSYRAKRMTPFVHALFGWDRASLNATTITGVPSPVSSAAVNYTDFALALGGGLDYKITRHLALRVGQLDLFRTSRNLNSFYGSAFGPGRFADLATHENNIRFSAGITLRF
jgi:opacity protein-like surface antigen